jgi:sulfotransferase family protein
MALSADGFKDLARGTDVFLAGSGRSGTTWVQELINHAHDHRVIFEPFLGSVVPFCRHFERRQYLRGADDSHAFLNPARKILGGKFRNEWADQYNDRPVYHKRLVKDIRANLLLHWLRRHFPAVPIVFLMRHPCAVVSSQLKGRWGTRAVDFLQQPHLVEDFLIPFAGLIHYAQDDFDNLLLVWCIENYVPLQQFRRGEIFLLFYEELIRNPECEVERLFSFLKRPVEPCAFEQLRLPSAQSSEWSAVVTGDDRLDSWRRHLDAHHVQRAVQFLRLFGLDELYGEDTMPRVRGAQLSNQ